MSEHNPYMRDGKWYWFDETEQESEPYPTRTEAEIDLLAYAYWLNKSEDIRPAIIERWQRQMAQALAFKT